MKDEMSLLVSVIIPAYNASAFISETINSVLSQTFRDVEIIVVNDGSTDDTVKKVQEFDDTRIRLLSIENAGVSNARNVGYRECKGTFVAFLDADDVWNKENLELKVDFLKINPNYGLVHSDCEVIDAFGNATGEVKSGKSGEILDSLLLWDGTNIPAPSSILVKKEVLEDVGGFNLTLSTAADQEFFFRVANKYLIGRVSETTWKYRVHGQNMHQNIMHMEEDHIRAYNIASELGLFHSKSFRSRCYARMHFILAGSWWRNGDRNLRTFLNLWKSFKSDPVCFFGLLTRKFSP